MAERSRLAPGYQQLCTLSEPLLRTPLGGWLNDWEMRRKIRKLQVQQESLRPGSEAFFSADCCKGHFDPHGRYTLRRYADRLDQLQV
jgi:hypothetical protein